MHAHEHVNARISGTAATQDGWDQKHNLQLLCVNFIGKFMDNFQQTFPK